MGRWDSLRHAICEWLNRYREGGIEASRFIGVSGKNPSSPALISKYQSVLSPIRALSDSSTSSLPGVFMTAREAASLGAFLSILFLEIALRLPRLLKGGG